MGRHFVKKQKKILTSNIHMYTYCMDYQCICYICIRISYVHICLVYQLRVH